MSSSLIASTLTSFPSPNTQRTFKTRTKGFIVSCNAAPQDHNDSKMLVLPNVERRNLLVGLDGLYTAVNLTSLQDATAEPITTPDITQKPCKKEVSSGIRPGTVRPRDCCPPNLGKTIQDFSFPSENTVRMRWPAHKGTDKKVDDYRKAIQAMRNLPDDHPHSFASQAKIHCAYCHGGYTQVDKDGNTTEIQGHNSWLFFPFHRMYLYFYERILRKLIDDPTFALPYWKWDDPARMKIPDIFVREDISGTPNPLYDVYREASHLPPATVDLNFHGKDEGFSYERQIACNLSTVYRELVRTEGDPLGFFGGRYVAGSAPVKNGDKSIGSVERGSHTAVHRWVGDSKLANHEDMGLFYSAGYDPLFYCHQANVDRMWKLWKDLSPGNMEPNDPDWLNASYLFYDENENLVRVYNRDSVYLKNLRYNYIKDTKELFPWRKGRPTKRNPSDQVGDVQGIKTVEETTFPLRLDRIQKVRVKRPAVQKTEEEKANMPNEILLIDGIKFDCNKFVKFDVFVNDKVKDGVVNTPCDPEYAGGFAQIPHSVESKTSMSSAVRFGLN